MSGIVLVGWNMMGLIKGKRLVLWGEMELYTKHKGRRASMNVKEEFGECVCVCVYVCVGGGDLYESDSWVPEEKGGAEQECGSWSSWKVSEVNSEMFNILWWLKVYLWIPGEWN